MSSQGDTRYPVVKADRGLTAPEPHEAPEQRGLPAFPQGCLLASVAAAGTGTTPRRTVLAKDTGDAGGKRRARRGLTAFR